MNARDGFGLLLMVSLLLPLPEAVEASEVEFFRVQSRDDFLSGTLEGLAIDSRGNLTLAARGRRISEFPEPHLFCGASYRDGWVVGTGNAGAVFQIAKDGTATRLWSAEEPVIFAIWADPDGTIFAGSSPDGKVYRIKKGAAEVFFDPGETYIWDIKRARDGSLLVATGTEGRLYKVDKDGNGELLFDSDDTHLRTMAVLPSGDVLIGTAGEGLVLLISADGAARTLYDADHPEVVDLAIGPDGAAYAALLASEASLVDLSRSSGGNGQSEEKDGGSVRVTVSAGSGSTDDNTGSRPQGFSGPRSEIVRISPEGAVDSMADFESETVYALSWQRGRLWIGTGLEGKLYSLDRGHTIVEKDMEERQVMVLLEDEPGPAFATTNAAAFYRISDESETVGTFTSPAMDADQPSRFGSLRWWGELEGGSVRISARSGTSSRPDRTWSEWTEPQTGSEVSLSAVPPGRFVQWRAEVRGDGGASPVLAGVDLSYQQLNRSPRITSFRALAPGEVSVPSNFNPANQIFEPAHPNRQGIFNPLKASGKREERRRKNLWKKGFRTLQWEAEDPNEDELTFALSFQRIGSDETWLPMDEDLTESSYSFDATALPDGRYRFRLVAADRPSEALEAALTAEDVSAPVMIDHTPPRLVEVQESKGRYQIVVVDELNPLRGAELSIDGEEWRAMSPEDGILDGQRETLSFDVAVDARLALIRLTDAAFNVVTFDLRQETR